MRYKDLTEKVFESEGVPKLFLSLISGIFHIIAFFIVGIFYSVGFISGRKSGKIAYPIVLIILITITIHLINLFTT